MGNSHLLLNKKKHFNRDEAKENELNKEKQIPEEIENMHREVFLLEQELEQAKIDKVEADENRRILGKLYYDKVIDTKGNLFYIFNHSISTNYTLRSSLFCNNWATPLNNLMNLVSKFIVDSLKVHPSSTLQVFLYPEASLQAIKNKATSKTGCGNKRIRHFCSN